MIIGIIFSFVLIVLILAAFSNSVRYGLNPMKKLILLLPLCLILIGCAGTGGNQPMTKAVFTLAVSTGISVGSEKYPEAVPFLRIANPLICQAATGTNFTPAEIVAIIENSPAAQAAATKNGKLILSGAIILYGALFEGGGISNEDAKVWLQLTCDSINLGLPPLASPNAIAARAMSPKLPYLK